MKDASKYRKTWIYIVVPEQIRLGGTGTSFVYFSSYQVSCQVLS
jgi:hypothetical protein